MHINNEIRFSSFFSFSNGTPQIVLTPTNDGVMMSDVDVFSNVGRGKKYSNFDFSFFT